MPEIQSFVTAMGSEFPGGVRQFGGQTAVYSGLLPGGSATYVGLVQLSQEFAIINIGRADSSSSGNIDAEFRIRSARWHDQTGFHSSPTKIAMHDDYQRIMGMGPQAIPLILADLRDNMGYWFHALQFIVGHDVAAGSEDFEAARAAWLEWGYRENYL